MEKRCSSSTVAVLVLMVILLVPVCSYSMEGRGVTKDTIKMGGIVDMTGPVTALTFPMIEGWRNHVRYLNEQGGINGRKIKLILEDDRYSIPMGVAAFKKLVFKDKVLALFGPVSTGETKALFPQIEKQKMPSMTYSFAREMTTPYRKYVFTLGPTYEDQLFFGFDYIMKNAKNPKIAVVYPDNPYGKIALFAARERAKFHNIKLAAETVINFGEMDASSQALRLRMARINYILIQENVGATVTLLRNLKKLNHFPSFISLFYSCSEDVVKLGGNAAENYMGINNFSFWGDKGKGMAELRKIAKKYAPDKGPRSLTHIQGWVNSVIFAEALKRAGKDLNPESFVNALETLRDFDTGGICGPITYTSSNHKATEYCRVYKSDVNTKSLVPITEWIKPVE